MNARTPVSVLVVEDDESMRREFVSMIDAAADLSLLDWRGSDARAAHHRGDINKRFPLMRLPDGAFRKWRGGNWKTFRTCNVGVWREDFVRVNGFDENFQGWGYEDSDLAVRLLRAGCRIKNGRFGASVYHLWHRENDRTQQAENWQRFLRVLKSDHIAARCGLDQYQSLA